MVGACAIHAPPHLTRSRDNLLGDYRRTGDGPLRLKALPAENRPTLGRLKRNGRLHPTCRAVGARLRSRKARRRRSASSTRRNAGTARFAGLTALGVVLELLVKEKQLFPGGKDELPTTVIASQQTVDEFHVTSPIHGKVLGPGLAFRGGSNQELTAVADAVP